MRLTPRFALVPVLLAALAVTPVLPAAGASPTVAVPLPIVTRFTPEPVSVTDVTAVTDGFRVPPRGGTATLRIHSARPITNLVVLGQLTGHVLLRFSISTGGQWQPLDIAEPAGRGPASAVATELYTFPADETTAEVRIQFAASPDGGLFTQFRIYGEEDVSTGVPTAAAMEPRPGSADPKPALPAAPAAIGSIPLVSRLTWGSPNGESSPAWLPAYREPFHIIIHHTAGPQDANGATDVANIWADHAIDQGWGDIGYNFLIDTRGTIYEGRAGGSTVAGGHTIGYNYGAIGISLIGNFDVQKPSKAMLNSLVRLVTQLSNQFGINVLGVTQDDSHSYYNLAGHRDFNYTSCPGTNVYRLLPTLRSEVAPSVRSEATLLGAGIANPGDGAPAMATLQVENTGTTTWNGRFSLRLTAGGIPGLPNSYDVPDVAPGGVVTVPLFLPATATNGANFDTTWQLYDASNLASGAPFSVTIADTAAAWAPNNALPDLPGLAPAKQSANSTANDMQRTIAALHAASKTTPTPDLLDAVRGAAPVWYFAEGSSAITDRETLDFLNPGATPAYIVTTLVRADGRRVYAVTNVPPRGRATLDAADAAGPGAGLSAIVQSSEPIYASRTMYHGSALEEDTGAAESPGLRGPGPNWYLPALDVIGGESERLSILNPAQTPVTVRVLTAVHGSLREYRQVTLPGLSLSTVNVPNGAASSEVLQLGPGNGVVVEEERTYQNDDGYIAASGLPAPITSGYLLTPGAGAGKDAVLLLNPGPQYAAVTLTGIDRNQKTVWTHTVDLPPTREMRVDLPSNDAGWGAVILQTNHTVAASYTGILAPGGEKTLARHYAGSVSGAFAQPAREHVFAEGDTRALLSAPKETINLENPTSSSVHVSLILLGTGGIRLSRSITLAPHADTVVNVNGWAPPGQHGVVALSDQPILAVQSIGFNEGVDRLYSAGIRAS